jgi:hypothetical protein
MITNRMRNHQRIVCGAMVKFDFFIPGELSFTRFGMPLKKGYPFDARPLMPCRFVLCARSSARRTQLLHSFIAAITFMRRACPWGSSCQRRRW